MTQNSIKTPSRLEITLALDCLDRLGITVQRDCEGWVVVKISGHTDVYLKPAEAIVFALKLIAAAMTIERERVGTA